MYAELADVITNKTKRVKKNTKIVIKNADDIAQNIVSLSNISTEIKKSEKVKKQYSETIVDNKIHNKEPSKKNVVWLM